MQLFMISCFFSVKYVVHSVSFGENPRIAELTRSKQEKMERLQKCEGTTKALKIAGLSTIGLTAVGVVGNVVEAQKLKEYQGQSNTLDTQIAQTKKEIEDKKAEIEKKKPAAPTEPTKPTEIPTAPAAKLAAVNKDINGSSYKAYNKNGTCDIYANDEWKYDVENPAQTCSGLEKGQWKVDFSYGSVSGDLRCSSTSGTFAVAGNPASSDGQYCWCKARYYTPNGGQRQDVASSSWVFSIDLEFADSLCSGACAHWCTAGVKGHSDFRAAMFAGAQ